MAERRHSFEAELFLVGYDLLPLMPGGWSISDLKNPVYRKRKSVSSAVQA